jgi:hypothetical protein
VRIETNERLVQRNRRLANYLFLFSMAILIGGFIIANTQLNSRDQTAFALALILPWLVLPIGFIATMTSIRMTNLWVRKPRPEDAILANLKGLSRKSALYNYYHFPARHVLITPQGVFTITTRFQEGTFTVDGDKWKTRGGAFGAFLRFFRRDDIGNPTADALKQAAHVQKYIEPIAPEVKVQPLVVFIDPRANLDIHNPTVPVLYADTRKEPNLKDYLRDIARQQEPAPEPVKKKPGAKAKSVEKPKSNALPAEEIAEAFEEATLKR